VNGPMGNLGAATDIESGEMLREEPFNGPSNQDIEAKMQRVSGDYQDLMMDLAGDGGAVVREVVSLLAQRINKLIEKDPEAKAYARLLVQIGHKINFGEKISNSLIARAFEKKQAPQKDSGLE